MRQVQVEYVVVTACLGAEAWKDLGGLPSEEAWRLFADRR